MTARAEKKPVRQVAHPVPIPTGQNRYRYFGQNVIGATLAKVRRDSGYTSLRLSKATLALLREVERLSVCNGLDELLYFDALQRLAKMPPELIEQEKLRRANLATNRRRNP